MSSNPELPVQQSEERPPRGNVIAVVALILALVAVGLSAWTAFRPAPKSTQEFSAADQAAAKVTTCDAANLVRKGVSLNTNLQSPGGADDVTGSLAVAANARLSLSEGGQYLLARITPATPADVTESATKFANTLMDIGASVTAGALNTDPDQAGRLKDADTENARLAAVCK